MNHTWTEAPEGHEYCGKCGLLEWHAGLDSVCSGEYGVAEEAN